MGVDSANALAINQARMAHLDSLKLPVQSCFLSRSIRLTAWTCLVHQAGRCDARLLQCWDHAGWYTTGRADCMTY